MTKPDDHDPRRDAVRRIVRAVRNASEPAPDAGAARRIADGAWERAGTPRASGRARRRIRGVSRRWTIAAAALLVVGLGAFALRPTEPVFAVEGEPVQVWRDDGWETTRRVRPGATVFVAQGVDALRGRGALEGEVIVPAPGTTFRIVSARDGDGRFTVQILGGAAEIRGGALRLSLADVEVAPRGTDAAFEAWGSLPEARDVSGPPTAVVEAARDALARIRIGVGTATLLQRSTGERLELCSEEMAAILPVPGEGRTVYRLGRVRRFEPTLGVHIADGHPVLDVRRSADGALAVLGGPGDDFTGVAIDSTDLPVALDQIHTAMLVFVTGTGVSAVDGPGRHIALVRDARAADGSLESRAVAAGETLTEVSATRDGEHLRVLLRGAGSVEIERNGVVSEHASLDAARDADAEAVELIAPYLAR